MGEDASGSTPGDSDAEPRRKPLIDRLGRWLFGLPLPVFYLVAVALPMLRGGVGVFPALDLELRVARALPALPAVLPNQTYFFYSTTGEWIARALGIYSGLAYTLLHLLVILGGLAACALYARRRFGDGGAKLLLAAFGCAQLPIILFGWLGVYDAFTFVFATALALAEAPVAVFAWALLLGFNHFEQGVFIVVCLALATRGGRAWVRWTASSVAGLAAGKLVVELFVLSQGVHTGRVSYVAGVGTAVLLLQFLRVLPVIIATGLGAFWIWLGVLAAGGERTERVWVRWALALAIPFIASMVADDETRVYALISWPIVVTIALSAPKIFGRVAIRRAATAGLFGSLIIPAVFVWQGQVHFVGFGQLVHAILPWLHA